MESPNPTRYTLIARRGQIETRLFRGAETTAGVDMSTRTARCHCGRLELKCEGEPRKVSMCHCADCQRRTGSAFSVAVFYERARVTVAKGETRQFERPSASGHRVIFHFCPDCGSNLYWRPARMPDLIGVALGGFADPSFPPPEQSVWMQDHHDWIVLPAGMPAFERNPPPRQAPASK